MYPRAEKMMKPARILVRELTMDIVRVSLWRKKKSFVSLSFWLESVTALLKGELSR